VSNTNSFTAHQAGGADYVIGVDLGTSGVRATAATAGSGQVATASRPVTSVWDQTGGHEQNPGEWWRLLLETLGEVIATMEAKPPRAIAITSTSGSLVPVNRAGVPVRPAMMYDDVRAAPAARYLNELDGSGQWNHAHSLAKAVWIRDNEPEAWEKVSRLLHPADWLIGKLSGNFDYSDSSNALKLGFDPESREWTTTIAAAGVDPSLLPRVKKPGTLVNYTSAPTSRKSGLNAGVPLISAGTDGLASLIASGASAEGDANTTIGTTIVWKCLSKLPIFQLPGTYNHMHPVGLWAPGAASSAGGACLRFGEHECEEWNIASEPLLPTQVYCYPLKGTGERFPFHCSAATAFLEGSPADELEMHAARLQAIAFVERWGYEQLEAAGCSASRAVFSAGSVCSGDVFNRVRASVLGRSVLRAIHPSAAYGAAVLAASHIWFAGDVAASIKSMVRIASREDPNPRFGAAYDDHYQEFRQCCRDRGYGT
jgi:sugar (pentulose or hexulose) kinase